MRDGAKADAALQKEVAALDEGLDEDLDEDLDDGLDDADDEDFVTEGMTLDFDLTGRRQRRFLVHKTAPDCRFLLRGSIPSGRDPLALWEKKGAEVHWLLEEPHKEESRDSMAKKAVAYFIARSQDVWARAVRRSMWLWEDIWTASDAKTRASCAERFDAHLATLPQYPGPLHNVLAYWFESDDLGQSQAPRSNMNEAGPLLYVSRQLSLMAHAPLRRLSGKAGGDPDAETLQAYASSVYNAGLGGSGKGKSGRSSKKGAADVWVLLPRGTLVNLRFWWGASVAGTHPWLLSRTLARVAAARNRSWLSLVAQGELDATDRAMFDLLMSFHGRLINGYWKTARKTIE